MTPEIFIKRQCNALQVKRTEIIQSLWSGYGEIARYGINGTNDAISSLIVKHCRIPSVAVHPRGWQSAHAHQRKVTSYEVEQFGYQHYLNQHCNQARVANCYGAFTDEESSERLLLLEDLRASGFEEDYDVSNRDHLLACIDWLANFHAGFLYDSPPLGWPQGLWEKGTYWHLDTRQEEWLAMEEGELKDQAAALSRILDGARFKCLVHGDAKVANFCFSADGKQVAAVDFQYLGGGVGVQDLVYLLGSALSEFCLQHELGYLQEHYFQELARAIMAQGENQAFAQQVVEEWQSLFTIAWADFHRFIMGWCPDHAKNTPLSRELTEQALEEIRNQAK